MVLHPGEAPTVQYSLGPPVPSLVHENVEDAAATSESLKILLRQHLLLIRRSYLLMALALTLLNEWVPLRGARKQVLLLSPRWA
jgi:hypothetical protein